MLVVAFALALVVGYGQAPVVVISHRGEHLRHPENTLAAFEAASRAGADFFELDVRTSSDGKLILSHDDTVDRCTNGHGKVAELTFAQLRALDAGGSVMPTFDEALALARRLKIGVYVDWKNASASELVASLDRHQMAEQVVIYCGRAEARKVLALNGKLKVMPEAASVERARELIEEFHPRVMAFDARDFLPGVIAIAKRAGALVYVDRLGEADNPVAWQAAIDAGANGIQTDKPAELVEFLRRKGLH